MKTTFTLPQAIKNLFDFRESTVKTVVFAVIAFAICAVVVLKFGNTIN